MKRKSRGKKTYRRKRIYRKKRMMKRSVLGQQRYFKHRLTRVIPVNCDQSGYTVQSQGFAWQQPGALVGNVWGFDNTVRWGQCKNQYEQFSITGMRIKWIPGNLQGSINPANTQQVGGFVGPMFVYSDIDTYDCNNYSDAMIVSLDSNRIKDATKTWSMYFSCKKLSKSMNVPWQDTSAYSSTAFNTLTKASTTVRFTYQGIQQAAPIGYFKVDWYMTFRGQAYSQ